MQAARVVDAEPPAREVLLQEVAELARQVARGLGMAGDHDLALGHSPLSDLCRHLNQGSLEFAGPGRVLIRFLHGFQPGLGAGAAGHERVHAGHGAFDDLADGLVRCACGAGGPVTLLPCGGGADLVGALSAGTGAVAAVAAAGVEVDVGPAPVAGACEESVGVGDHGEGFGIVHGRTVVRH